MTCVPAVHMCNRSSLGPFSRQEAGESLMRAGCLHHWELERCEAVRRRHNFINRRDNPPAQGNQVAGQKWRRIGEQQECQASRWFPVLLSSWAEVQQEVSADANTAVTHHDMWWDQQWVGCDVEVFFFFCFRGHTYVKACLHIYSHSKKKKKKSVVSMCGSDLHCHQTSHKVCCFIWFLEKTPFRLATFFFFCIRHLLSITFLIVPVTVHKFLKPNNFPIFCHFKTGCLFKSKRPDKVPPLKTNLKQEIALLTPSSWQQRKRASA